MAELVLIGMILSHLDILHGGILVWYIVAWVAKALDVVISLYNR